MDRALEWYIINIRWSKAIIEQMHDAMPQRHGPMIMRSIAYRIALLLATAVWLVLSGLSANARGPEAIADLTSEVMDAVVNISASEIRSVPRRSNFPTPIPGTPFSDLFEEYRKNRNDKAPKRNMQRSESAGSGFVIDQSGIIVTNNHVIGEANDITVIFSDGVKRKAEIVGRDDKLDLAVLRVKADKPLKAVKFGASDHLRIGDWVVAIGNPFGLGGTVTAGIISAQSRDISQGPYDDYIQTDAAINRGNSGGPLFNMKGEVIGINTAILSPTGGSVGIGFAVPAELAAPTIEQLRINGETRRGWLGVRIQPVDEDTADALGLSQAEGALIASIDEKGPASSADLKIGDVIIRINGKAVKEPRDLSRTVAVMAVGAKANVGLIRKGKEHNVLITLGRLEDSKQAANKEAITDKDNEPLFRRTFGLDLAQIDEGLRQRFAIRDGIMGVVVVEVDPQSTAADKNIEPGDIITGVGEQAVKTPTEVEHLLDVLRKNGKRSALLLVSSKDGDERFVALRIYD